MPQNIYSPAYIKTYNLINRFGQKVKATTRFGDEDVWEFINRSPDFKNNWITVRDHKLRLNYSCWIEAFSDSGKERELLLREVKVYSDETCAELYSVDTLYLSRKSDEITLEANLIDIDAENKEKESLSQEKDTLEQNNERKTQRNSKDN
jgi:hypothetical protein